MKKSGLYQIGIRGEIFEPDSYSLYLVPNTGTVSATGTYPEPRSSQLDQMLSNKYTLRFDISKKPYRIYCLDAENNEVKEHEIVFWFIDASNFYGEHMNSGYIISGFCDGDLDTGSPSLFVGVDYFKFNNIEFHPMYSKSAGYMTALKRKWEIYNSLEIQNRNISKCLNNNMDFNTKTVKNDRYNYRNN